MTNTAPPHTDQHRANATDRNTVTMLRFYRDVMTGDLTTLPELASPDIVNQTAPEGQRIGYGPVEALVLMLTSAFPDGHYEVEDMVAHENTVVMRDWFSGTHTGGFLGHAATGRTFRFRQMHWMRFGDDGRIVEHWGVRDDLTHLQQLGLVP
jgi:predicted ester cyclase